MEWKNVYLSYLKVFGYSLYAYIIIGSRSKLDPKFIKCTFIEYDSKEFGYKFWDYQNHKFIKSGNVTFNEREMYKDGIKA